MVREKKGEKAQFSLFKFASLVTSKFNTATKVIKT